MKQKLFLTVTFLLPFLIGMSQSPGYRDRTPPKDSVMDRFGNLYSLKDIQVSQQHKGIQPLSVSPTYQAGDFELTFNDAGIGFDDMTPYGSITLGEARRKVAIQVFKDISTLIIPTPDPVTGNNPKIKILVLVSIANGIPKTTFGVFGIGSPYVYEPFPRIGFVDNDVWKTINTGENAYKGLSNLQPKFDENSFHGQLKVNFTPDSLPPGITYHLDLSTPAGANEIDLYSVILHEAFHILGYGSLITANGTFNSSYPGYSRWDSHLNSVSSGKKLLDISGCDFPVTTSAPVADVTSGCSNLKFDTNFPVYAPSIYKTGSSLSHLDPSCTGVQYIMQNSIGRGDTRRIPTQDEVNILCAMNYHINNEFGTSLYPISHYTSFTGCDKRIAGRNDYKNSITNNPYVVKGGTDITITDALNNDVNAVKLSCLEIHQGDGIITNVTNTSFTFHAISATTNFAWISYIPVDANGNKGQFTYVLIYIDADDAPCSINDCNLVPNGGFEDFSVCPRVGLGYAGRCRGWFSPAFGSPDAFSSCIPQYGTPGVPTNHGGTHDPHSGQNYGGFLPGEWFETKLCKKMVAGVTYQIKFYTMLSPNSTGTPCDSVGIYLTPNKVALLTTYAIPTFKPQVVGLNISDKTNWVLVQGNYTAQGGEEYLIAGLPIKTSGSNPIFYYIDDISIVETTPGVCNVGCKKLYDATLGKYGNIDSIDVAGGTYTFQPGNIHVLGSIKLKNGTYTVNTGTTLYMEGHKEPRYIFNSPSFDYTPLIVLENATLKVNGGTLTAACDTMWGGIYSYFPNNFNSVTNRVEIVGQGPDSSEVSHANTGLTISDQSNIFLTYPSVIQRASWKIDKARFLNNRLSIEAGKYFQPLQKDTISNCRFDSDPSKMKAPYNNGKEYSFGAVRLFYRVRNSPVLNCKINNTYYGVFNNGESLDINVQKNTFNNNFIGAVWCYGGSERDTSIILNNTFNFPNKIATGLSPALQSQTVGIYHGGIGFRADGNKFNGNKSIGTQQQAIVHSIFADSKGIDITNNTFNNMTVAVNNLDFKYQGANIAFNTFNSTEMPVFTDNNGNGLTPLVYIHCNDFNKLGASSPTAAIFVGGNGKLGDLGACQIGQTAGNKFNGYNTLSNLAINNLGAGMNYFKSLGEVTNLSWGTTNGVNQVSCGLPSNCPAGGVGQLIGPAIETLRPAFAEVQVAIQQLKRQVLLPVQQQIEPIRTIIRYYRGSCSPEYQSVVNNMLPENLYAYNQLAWNLTECAITGQNIPLALQMMNEIEYNNPGNIAIQMRSTYYQVMIRTTGQSSSFGIRATAQDINLLAQVAASGTDFSAAACYALVGLAPDRAGQCVTLPNPSQGLRIRNGSPAIEGNSEQVTVAFANAPNPFSISTKVTYALTGNPQKAVLKVYDIQGRLAKAVNLDVAANEVTIYADDMKNGVYSYSIETDGVTTAAKGRMVVIK